MKRFTRIVSFMAIILLFAGCHNDDPYDYIPASLKDVILHHLNNQKEWPEPITDGKVNPEAYILRLELNIETHYGLSDWEAYYLTEPIRTINIYTLNDYNNLFPAGSDVSTCFRNYPLKLSDSVNYDNGDYDGIRHIYTQKASIYKAMMAPPQPGIHQFRVVITLENREEIERITDPVEFNYPSNFD